MRNIILILVILFTIGCGNEPNLSEYKVCIKNTSGQNLFVTTYSNGELFSVELIASDQSGLSCNYFDEQFFGYRLTACEFDSIKFVFTNSKGYLSSINYSTNEDFEENSRPFGNSNKFIRTENNKYNFIITEEDYENAFELPE